MTQTMTPAEQAKAVSLAAQVGFQAARESVGWITQKICDMANKGQIYAGLNDCEIVPAADATFAQGPLWLVTRDAAALLREARLAVQNAAIKRFFGGVLAAAGTNLVVTVAIQVFGWRVRLSSDTLTWNFAQLKVTFGYNSQNFVVYVTPKRRESYVDFIALAVSNNAGKGSIAGPTTATITLDNPATPADSPGSIPSKTAMSIETINVRDLQAS